MKNNLLSCLPSVSPRWAIRIAAAMFSLAALPTQATLTTRFADWNAGNTGTLQGVPFTAVGGGVSHNPNAGFNYNLSGLEGLPGWGSFSFGEGANYLASSSMTITFSQPVTDPILVAQGFRGYNANNNGATPSTTTYTFNVTPTKLTSSEGSVSGNSWIVSNQPGLRVGALKFVGTFTTISWTTTATTPTWGNNFTLAQTADVPLPEIAVEEPVGTVRSDSASINFGTVNAGENVIKTFTITNSGDGALTGLSISKDGEYADEFTVGALSVDQLLPGESTTFTVTFSPVGPNYRYAHLSITNNDLNENPYDLNLNGEGVGGNSRPYISDWQSFSVDENSANGTVFGTIDASDPDVDQTLTYTITAGNDNGAFSINANGQITVANSSALNYENTSYYQLTVRVADNGSPSTYDSTTVWVYVNDVFEVEAPEIGVQQPLGTDLVSGASVDFGSQTVFVSAPVSFTITNSGSLTLYNLSVSVSGANADDFVASPLEVTSLEPNASTTFTVTFTADEVGSRTADLYIASDDADENPFYIALTGNSTAPAVGFFNHFTGNSGGNPAGWTDLGDTFPQSTVIESGTEVAVTDYRSVSSGGGPQFIQANSVFSAPTSPSATVTLKTKVTSTTATSGTADVNVGIGTVSGKMLIAIFKGSTKTFQLFLMNNLSPIGVGAFTLPAGPHLPDYSGGTMAVTLFVDTDSVRLTCGSFDSGDLLLSAVGGATVDSLDDLGTLTAVLGSGISASGAASATANFDKVLFEISNGGTFAPEIGVKHNNVDLTSGVGTIDLGNYIVNETGNLEILFKITNSGNTTLTNLTQNAFGSDVGAHIGWGGINKAGTFDPINTLAPGEAADAYFTYYSFDAGTHSDMTLQIQSSDADENPFNIAVTAKANTRPAIDQSQTFSVDENSANETSVGTASANDPDGGQSLTYEITGGNTSGAFAINSTSGAITVANNSLDYETTSSYVLTVKVTDNGPFALTDEETVTINVNDVEPEGAVISALVEENFEYGSLNGALIGLNGGKGFTGAWTQQGSDYTYVSSGLTLGTLSSSGGAAMGTRSSGVGGSTFAGRLLSASIQAAPTVWGSFLWKITDFGNGFSVTQNFSLGEPGETDATEGSFSVITDLFGPVTGTGIRSEDANGGFARNLSGGTLTADTTYLALYKFERFPGQDPQAQLTCWVLTEAQLANFSAGGFNESQLNAAPLGNGATQVFARGSETLAQTYEEFVYDPETDNFDFVTTPLVLGSLDKLFLHTYTQGQTGQVVYDRIRISDVSLSVAVNDAGANTAPTDISLSNSSVSENEASETTVGTLSAVDSDSGGTHTFTLVSGDGDTDNEFFSISDATLETAAGFDYEIKNSYSIRVRVEDAGALSYEKTFTISVTDVNEAPEIEGSNGQTFSVDENSANGTVVETVSATDPDAGQTLTYAITDGNTGGAFAINASSGEITVADSAQLDYEVQSSYALTVQVTDNGSPVSNASGTITVNLNDVSESPEIVMERPAGTDFANGATANFGMVNGTADLIFTLKNIGGGDLNVSSISRHGDDESMFTIVASPTLPVTAGGSTTFTIRFAPTSGGVKNALFAIHNNDSDESMFVVNVRGEGSNTAPSIPAGQVLTVSENSTNGTVVGTVIANDAEVGSLTYSITDGNTGDAFAIDAATGELTVNNGAVLDFETTPSFTLAIQVVDSGAETASGMVTVNLSNVTTGTDMLNPTITLSAPLVDARITGINTVASGKASDTRGLQLVVYQLNGGTWRAATATTNWTAALILTPGTNTLAVKSIDRSDRHSTTITRKFFSVVSLPIAVNVNGGGTVSIANGTLLDIGKSYTIKATHPTSVLFSNWTGSVTSTNKTLTFVMATNFTLNANFLGNFFPAVSYTYKGLFYEATGVNHNRSGTISILLSKAQTFSGTIVRGSQSIAISGKFGLNGKATVTKSGLTINLELNVNNVETLGGTVTGSDWTADIVADRIVASFNGAGKYSLALDSTNNGATAPGGSAVILATAQANGRMDISLRLPDFTSLAKSFQLSQSGHWPFYVTTHNGAGSMLGWLTVSNLVTNTISGVVSWVKTETASGYYPAGFTNDLVAAGSRLNYRQGVRLLSITNSVATSSGGHFDQARTNYVTVNANNSFVTGGTNGLVLTTDLKTGFLQGTITNPVTGVKMTIRAAPLQQQNRYQGFVVGSDKSGPFTLESKD